MEELTPWSCAEARASMRGERGIGMRRGGGRREEKEGPRETRRGEERRLSLPDLLRSSSPVQKVT